VRSFTAAYRLIDFRRGEREGGTRQGAHFECSTRNFRPGSRCAYEEGRSATIIAPEGLGQGDLFDNVPCA